MKLEIPERKRLMKKYKRIAALALVFSLIVANIALADTVVLADRPFGAQAANGIASQQTGDGTLTPGSVTGPGYEQPLRNSSSGISGTAGAAPGQDGGQTAAPGQGTKAVDPNAGQVTAGPSSAATGKGGVETETSEIVIDAKIPLPQIYSDTAVLMDASTGQVLFDKGSLTAMYPASTTKLMTALLTVEKLGMNDVIKFSAAATTGLESGAVTANMTAGETMTVKDALHALLLYSACEVANALGENVAGSEAAFASMMNEKAKALGCRNTSFKNASGLNNSEHVTCAYDLALIARAAISNDNIRAVMGTKTYTLPASKKRSALTIKNTNKMLFSENAEYYDGIIGGKTGYTSKAAHTLVEAANVNGHTLIAVAMRANSEHFNDCKRLFDYGKQLLGNTGAGTTSPENQGRWEDTAAGRKYKKPDGSYAVSEWIDYGDNEYYFDEKGIVATGWKKFSNGAWYYLDPDTGAMIHDKWVSTDGQKYYYLRSNGVMATNTVINGMYRVDANGVYVEKVA